MTPGGTPRTATEPPVLQAGAIPLLLLLLVGAGASAIMLWSFTGDPQRAFHSYLTAYAFALSLALGSMGFVMISHAANTTWPVAVRRLSEAATGVFPLLALLFVPIAFGIGRLYPWAHPEAYSGLTRHLLEHRRAFMNPAFFVARAAVYLLSWCLLAWLLRRWSFAMDRGRDPEACARKLRLLSSFALPLAALTTAFAAFDWLMSLSPEFSSTMFGALWVAICLFGGMACTIVLAAVATRNGTLSAAGPSHYHALGRLLFAFLIFLGYVSFFQFMLCWIGNKPSEAEWYVERSYGAYEWESVFLVFGHFFVPFFLLLSFRLKRSAKKLLPVAMWCLFAQYLHVHWLVTPGSAQPGFSWLDLAALLSVLCLCVAFGLFVQRGKSLAAVADPQFSATLTYQSR